jgi:2'-5' RNA ligase
MSANPLGESAIIVPVEAPVAMRRLRDRFDPTATQGVPAHVTLLYPFMPPSELTDEVRERIASIVASEPTFSFTLARMDRWPDVVWLAPEPAEPFSRLIEALQQAFPDYPAYGGAHPVIVPHVTIAADPRPDWLAAAERALPAMLPVRDVCREAWLIAHEPARPWSSVQRLPLGKPR